MQMKEDEWMLEMENQMDLLESAYRYSRVSMRSSIPSKSSTSTQKP